MFCNMAATEPATECSAEHIPGKHRHGAKKLAATLHCTASSSWHSCAHSPTRPPCFTIPAVFDLTCPISSPPSCCGCLAPERGRPLQKPLHPTAFPKKPCCHPCAWPAQHLCLQERHPVADAAHQQHHCYPLPCRGWHCCCCSCKHQPRGAVGRRWVARPMDLIPKPWADRCRPAGNLVTPVVYSTAAALTIGAAQKLRSCRQRSKQLIYYC